VRKDIKGYRGCNYRRTVEREDANDDNARDTNVRSQRCETTEYLWNMIGPWNTPGVDYSRDAKAREDENPREWHEERECERTRIRESEGTL
jgi:hypothetical protein